MKLYRVRKIVHLGEFYRFYRYLYFHFDKNKSKFKILCLWHRLFPTEIKWSSRASGTEKTRWIRLHDFSIQLRAFREISTHVDHVSRHLVLESIILCLDFYTDVHAHSLRTHNNICLLIQTIWLIHSVSYSVSHLDILRPSAIKKNLIDYPLRGPTTQQPNIIWKMSFLDEKKRHYWIYNNGCFFPLSKGKIECMSHSSPASSSYFNTFSILKV